MGYNMVQQAENFVKDCHARLEWIKSLPMAEEANIQTFENVLAQAEMMLLKAQSGSKNYISKSMLYSAIKREVNK